MIYKTIYSEFGEYVQKYNQGYKVHSYYDCIDAFKIPEEGYWMSCPCCGLKPKVWEFNNGRQTACGCHNTRYDHFSVYAESIMSVHGRCNGSTIEYDCDELRKNWNDYCITHINPLNHSDLMLLGRW